MNLKGELLFVSSILITLIILTVCLTGGRPWIIFTEDSCNRSENIHSIKGLTEGKPLAETEEEVK